MGRFPTMARVIPIFILCVAFAGCAGEKPKANIANADMAIQRAREANAINYAPLELKTAEEKLQQAKKESDAEEYKKARWLADESKADAQVAEAKSRSMRSAQIEQQVRKDIDALRQEPVAPPPAIAPAR